MPEGGFSFVKAAPSQADINQRQYNGGSREESPRGALQLSKLPDPIAHQHKGLGAGRDL